MIIESELNWLYRESTRIPKNKRIQIEYLMKRFLNLQDKLRRFYIKSDDIVIREGRRLPINTWFIKSYTSRVNYGILAINTDTITRKYFKKKYSKEIVQFCNVSHINKLILSIWNDPDLYHGYEDGWPVVYKY